MRGDSTLSPDVFRRAALLLREGGVVAFPTETYYGLAVDPFNEAALQTLFAVKKRPEVKPVLVLIADRGQIDLLADKVPPGAERLMDRFWPGPLTLVLPARRSLPGLLTGGTGTVGIRQSPNPVAASLLRSFGAPLTATSANQSGSTPATSAGEVEAALGGRLDMILNGGPTPGVLGSTLVGWRAGVIECIREGCIPCAAIWSCLREGRGET